MNPHRILIVDDEPLIAMMLQDWLIELGFDVLGPALTAHEALALIDGGSLPDAAILDVTLKDGTSYDVAAALQQRSIPLIFATGHRQHRIDDRFKGTEMLLKPFDFEALRSAVTRMIAPDARAS